ncbi:MAG: SIMPL domain-containing protein [candidate division WOR-3 bacterium]
MKRFLPVSVLLIAINIAFAQAIDTTRTISVTGIGEIVVKPDICLISAGVLEEDTDAARVTEKLAQKMQQVIKTLQNSGVKKENIKTTGLQLYPVYDYDSKGKQILRGYRAQENISVKCDVKDAGNILKSIVNAGINTINNIQFDFSKRDSLEFVAIELAMKDARLKAERSIISTPYKISGIKSINIQSESTAIPYARTAKATLEVTSEVPVEEGEIKIRTSVFVVFTFQ